jgi:hypothetical protein
MKIKIPFYYRNKPLGEREVQIPETAKCPKCGGRARLNTQSTLYRIGPRYYAQYGCPMADAFMLRINLLTKSEIAKIRNHGTKPT